MGNNKTALRERRFLQYQAAHLTIKRQTKTNGLIRPLNNAVKITIKLLGPMR